MKFVSDLFGDNLFADAYVKTNTHTPILSGGLLFSGAALTALVAGTYSFIGEGGIDFSGDAAISLGYEHFVDGGLTISGITSISRVLNISSIGGFIFSGESTKAFSINIPTLGGIFISGKAGLTILRDYIGSNGVNFFGDTLTDQTIEYTYSPIISGNIEYPGTAIQNFIPLPTNTFTHLSNGGFELSGSGGILALFDIKGTGSVKFSGSTRIDNPTDHQGPEIVEFNLTINRSEDLEVVIDRDYEANIKITRKADFNHVM